MRIIASGPRQVNGGLRTKLTKPEEMGWLRLQGGVFDCFLPVASGRDHAHALWLEMKRTKNGVSWDF